MTGPEWVAAVLATVVAVLCALAYRKYRRPHPHRMTRATAARSRIQLRRKT